MHAPVNLLGNAVEALKGSGGTISVEACARVACTVFSKSGERLTVEGERRTMARALVVDDESDARAFVRAILQGEGWEVSEASDGDDAVKQARKLMPDLIILDVQMPRKDGFAVFGELVESPKTKDIKVIMLTGVREKYGVGFTAESVGEYVGGRKPDGYAEKPMDPGAFKRLVKKVMGPP